MFIRERTFAMVESTPKSQEAKALPAQVLVVEDEAEIRELIALLLLRQGYRVQQCSNAFEASDVLRRNQYDLVVLDWMLPQMSGIEFLKSLQRDGQSQTRPPVLMVTAKAEPQDIVAGLEAGADDYITKPFEPSVFQARVKALLRRTHLSQTFSKETLQFGDLTLNLASYEVSCSGQALHLTSSEFKILAAMAVNQGRVLTRDRLIEIVQGEGVSVTGRTIDTHVFGLRKKLGDCVDWVETIRGIGYRIKASL